MSAGDERRPLQSELRLRLWASHALRGTASGFHGSLARVVGTDPRLGTRKRAGSLVRLCWDYNLGLGSGSPLSLEPCGFRGGPATPSGAASCFYGNTARVAGFGPAAWDALCAGRALRSPSSVEPVGFIGEPATPHAAPRRASMWSTVAGGRVGPAVWDVRGCTGRV